MKKAIALVLALAFLLGVNFVQAKDTSPEEPLPPIFIPLAVSNYPPPYDPEILLISFDGGIDADFVNMLAASFGAVLVDYIPETGTYRWKFPDGTDLSAVHQLIDKMPNVQDAEPDYYVNLFKTVPNDPNFDNQWALSRIKAPQAWDVSTGGQDIVIAIVDTGVDLKHPDLASKLTSRSTWYDFGDQDNQPQDTMGHGTHTAGIAAAASNNGTGISGLSWNARVMPIKVFPDNRSSTTSSLVAYGIVHAVKKGADIISLSLGTPNPSRVVQKAVEYAHEHGVIVVAAAGNADTDTKYYPAAYDYVISVASTDEGDRKSSFSSYGSWVDVSAPGSNIYSTCLHQTYCYRSGTSMATPYAASLASLVLSEFPGWTPEQVELRIVNTADDIDKPNPEFKGKLGGGRINAYQALNRNTSAPYPAPYP